MVRKNYLKRMWSLGMQVILGSVIFNLPLLYKIRLEWYKRNFNMGKNCSIHPNVKITKLHPDTNSVIKIGNNVIICMDSFIDYTGGLDIGNDVCISQGSIIYTHEHDLSGKTLYGTKVISEPLKILDSAWVGTRSIILSSVKRIGYGSVIGAGSVVTKDIPDFTIVAGNPAKKIGIRNFNKNE